MDMFNRLRKVVLVQATIILALICVIAYGWFDNAYVCIEKLSHPISKSPPKGMKASVWGYTQPAHFRAGQWPLQAPRFSNALAISTRRSP